MSVPGELKSVTRNLLEQLLMCRPIDTISFAFQYYNDECGPNPIVNHAIHSLMFLLRRPDEFRAAVGTIYCSDIIASTYKKEKSNSSKEGSSSSSRSAEVSSAVIEGAQLILHSASNALDTTTPTGEDSSSKDDQNATLNASTGFANEDNKVTTGKHEDSLKVQALYRVARTAVRVVSESFSGSGAASSDGESQDPLCTLIENALGGDDIANSAISDFEACIAFLRSYLSMRVIAGQVCLSVKQRSKLSHQSELLRKTLHANLEVTNTVYVQPEDIELIEQIINATLGNSASQEMILDELKIVSAVVNQYMSLLLGTNNSNMKFKK